MGGAANEEPGQGAGAAAGGTSDAQAAQDGEQKTNHGTDVIADRASEGRQG